MESVGVTNETDMFDSDRITIKPGMRVRRRRCWPNVTGTQVLILTFGWCSYGELYTLPFSTLCRYIHLAPVPAETPACLSVYRHRRGKGGRWREAVRWWVGGTRGSTKHRKQKARGVTMIAACCFSTDWRNGAPRGNLGGKSQRAQLAQLVPGMLRRSSHQPNQHRPSREKRDRRFAVGQKLKHRAIQDHSRPVKTTVAGGGVQLAMGPKD